jgi:tRNA(fMet)-specific endonuclease VapC
MLLYNYSSELSIVVIGSYDMQIAAQAISNDLILVTNNTREFDRISRLKLENGV